MTPFAAHIFARVLGPIDPADPRNSPAGSVYFQPVIHQSGGTFRPAWTDTVRPERLPGDPSGREWPPLAVPFQPNGGPACLAPPAGTNLSLHLMGGEWRYYVTDVVDGLTEPPAGSWRDRPSLL